MWYNYCDEPVGKTEEEARCAAETEMDSFDIGNILVDAFGDMKYIFWCLRQEKFREEFSDDIEKATEIYFEENFEERDEEE